MILLILELRRFFNIGESSMLHQKAIYARMVLGRKIYHKNSLTFLASGIQLK